MEHLICIRRKDDWIGHILRYVMPPKTR